MNIVKSLKLKFHFILSYIPIFVMTTANEFFERGVIFFSGYSFNCKKTVLRLGESGKKEDYFSTIQ